MSFPNPALLKNDVFLEDSPLIYCFTFWESPKTIILCQRSRQLPCKTPWSAYLTGFAFEYSPKGHLPCVSGVCWYSEVPTMNLPLHGFGWI